MKVNVDFLIDRCYEKFANAISNSKKSVVRGVLLDLDLKDRLVIQYIALKKLIKLYGDFIEKDLKIKDPEEFINNLKNNE